MDQNNSNIQNSTDMVNNQYNQSVDTLDTNTNLQGNQIIQNELLQSQTQHQQAENLQSENLNFEQNPSNLDNNLSPSNNKKNKRNIVIILFVLTAIIIIVVGLVINNSSNKQEGNKYHSQTQTNDKINQTSTDGKYVIYINDSKIILGTTTIDEFIRDTDLEVIKDDSKGSCDYKDENCFDYREIKVSDGVNTIVLESLENSDKIKKVSTLVNGQTDDPYFDFSTGTKVVFIDNMLKKNISIGYVFTEDELDYENLPETSMGGRGELYVSQTEHLAEDNFVYYMDENLKVINMWATLSY